MQKPKSIPTPRPVPKPNDEGIYLFETARIELERVQIAIGSGGDYLDRGRPNLEERARTEAIIREYKEKAQVLKTEFNALVDDYRRKNPAVLEAWVQIHLDILDEIIAETDTSSELSIGDKTRIHVAQKTAAAWQEVRQGKRNNVDVNHYFMKDYNERLLKRMPGLDLKNR